MEAIDKLLKKPLWVNILAGIGAIFLLLILFFFSLGWITGNGKTEKVPNVLGLDVVAAQKLEDIFDNYIKYIPNAEKLRQQNSEKFTLEAGNKVFMDILDKNLPVFEKKVAITLPKFKKVTPVTPA